MKKLIQWGMLGLAAAVVALSGCGKGDDSGNVSVRVVNATNTHASLDLYINGSSVVTGTLTDTVSGYATPGSGANSLQVNDSATGAALAVAAPSLTGSDHYTLFAYESGGAVKLSVLGEDIAAPVSNTGQLRIYNAAPDAGSLDVYVTGPTDSLATASPAYSFTTGVVPAASNTLLTYAVGTYRVRVTASGNKNDLRLDMPVALANQQVGYVVLSPTTGGTLLNGSLLIQQSTYTAVRNTNVRVRLAAAVGSNAVVAASATAPAGAPATSVVCTGAANTCAVGTGTAPSFQFYSVVPANSALNVTVNGATVAAPAAAAVTAGSDLTLLVYGPAASATASLLIDDNHLPLNTLQAKVTLINGVTGAAGALTMTANSVLIAQNVAPGTASAATAITGSATAMNVIVTSSNAPGNLVTTSDTFAAGSVYVAMVAGDAAAPVLLLQTH